MPEKLIYIAIDEITTQTASDAFLPFLEAERDSLAQILNSPKSKDLGFTVALGGTQVKWMDIAKDVESMIENLTIFHFAGHANSTQLRLADKSVEGQSVAYLLQEASQLKLVFLNGCSTMGQVEEFLESNKEIAIIATYRPIPDTKATVFAESFYSYLILGKTIKESFDQAILGENLKPKDFHFRQLGPKSKIAFKNKNLWGIFCKNNDTLNWKLSSGNLVN